MTDLIALLSTGKGSWTNVIRLIKSQEWDKVYLVTNDFGKDKFNPESNTELIVCNMNNESRQLRDEIYNKLKDKVTGPEVAINMCSGTGKEHMALLTAILQLGCGIRFVDMNNEKFHEL